MNNLINNICTYMQSMFSNYVIFVCHLIIFATSGGQWTLNLEKDTPIPTIKITSISKRLSMERKKRINKIRRLSSKKEASHSNETFTADYGKFQERPLAFSSVCGTMISLGAR
ncbi:uncharacterized protein LOC111692185 [Anoplophora glabripennis]|uniref:uncharacterized protein LOC111692185 n=1 Tax=Anoplophora glabripennis TaxID=217634 RepID=UPI000C782B20|nr:uncharacterized protein LOC111692185 [Anoplophora glabripennis]